MSQSGEITDSELPSEHFQLRDEFRELEETEAKVELQERTKELAAITRANELFSELDRPIGELIDTYVTELPRWFQYPDVTEAQIAAGNAVAESAGFERTADPLTHEAVTETGSRIVIDVVYTEQRPEEDDGPWLAEEHDLLDTLLGFIKSYLNQWENQQQLEEQLHQQQMVADNVRSDIQSVKQTAEEMATSTNEISDHASNSAGSMNEVSREISEMSATVEQIASTAEEVAATSANAEELAKRAVMLRPKLST